MIQNRKILQALADCTGFDWDDGNDVKNWSKHHVSQIECEAVFLNDPIVRHDLEHSGLEDRFFALGRTDQMRYLTVCFLIRGKKIRVISARDMNSLEFRRYKNYEEASSKI